MSASATLLEWACAVSITSASTPALINSLDLFSKSLSTPIAAATLSLPKSSLLEIVMQQCNDNQTKIWFVKNELSRVYNVNYFINKNYSLAYIINKQWQN